MKASNAKVLIIDDDPDILMAARLLMRRQPVEVHTEEDPKKIAKFNKLDEFDVILLDMNFSRDQSSGDEGIHWLEKILKTDPLAVVVMITAYGDIELAVRAMKAGAYDFITKPWQNEKLWATISAAVSFRRARRQVDRLLHRQRQLHADLDQPFRNLIFSCEAMNRIMDVVGKVAATDASILILGENGTGKEVVAREIHRRSQRSHEAFISVDLGAISESLIESELFGHIRGAFTDARDTRVGRFEIATGGTLFLDEVGNLSTASQSKLLAALEKRQITPVGANASRDIDVRIISATNQPIHDKVAANEFRQDLLYRINTVEIVLPPLRERGDDILLLAEHFMKEFCRKYNKPVKRLDKAVGRLLKRYTWPGNIRELKHAIERAVIMGSDNTIKANDFALTGNAITGGARRNTGHNLKQAERELILKVLTRNNHNVSHAAKELGLTRASLYRRMHKYGL